MSGFKYVEDPILGKGRAEFDNGGGGGGGGTDYVFSNEFTVAGDTVSIASVSASKITGKVGSAGVADALINGATVGYAQSAGTATTANGVAQSVKDDIISSAGGGSLDGEIASVDEVMTGITGGTTAVVDVSGLRGALTAGQAVDVTSQPDSTTTEDWKGTFEWGGSVLGFSDFPKFADGLKYLMIADLTYVNAFSTSGGSVTPSGTWLDGTTSSIALPNAVKKRVAMLFNAASKGKFNFTYANSGEDTVEVTNLREYEVTACTPEAIAYIASLSNPDSFQDYYLVKRDMVSPWTYIIDMGESPTTTVAAGLAYQIKAMTGSHIITVDTCPEGYVGRETFVRIFVGQTGNVVVQSPLQLATPLIANAINNCHVSYRDGSAVLTVDDTVGGYIVDAASGTTAGTLYYGLMDSATEFISIPGAFDGIPVAIGGASVTTSGTARKYVVGNGISNTLISGNLNAGAGKLGLSNIALSDVGITGGTLTLFNGAAIGSGTTEVSSGASMVFSGGSITSGGTFLKGGGTLKIVDVGGDGGGVLDLNNTQLDIASGTSIRVHDVTMTRGSGTAGGFIIRKDVPAQFSNVHVSGMVSTQNALAILSFGGTQTLVVSGCTFEGATGGTGAAGYIYITSGTAEVTSCAFLDKNAVRAMTSGLAKISGSTLSTIFVDGGTVTFLGSNAMPSGKLASSGTAGKVSFADGAVLNASGNTNAIIINPGGTNNITFGANVTIINSAGTAVTLNSGNAGSCTQINKDGTIS